MRPALTKRVGYAPSPVFLVTPLQKNLTIDFRSSVACSDMVLPQF